MRLVLFVVLVGACTGEPEWQPRTLPPAPPHTPRVVGRTEHTIANITALARTAQLRFALEPGRLEYVFASAPDKDYDRKQDVDLPTYDRSSATERLEKLRREQIEIEKRLEVARKRVKLTNECLDTPFC